MALDPLVTVEDFAGWLGASFSDPEAERAGRVLVAVSSLVRSEAGLTWEDGAPEEVQTVVLNIATRVWRNPDAATSYSLTTGPYGKSITFADPRGVGLYLTAEEKAIVGRGRTVTRGLWTLGTTRNDAAADTIYVPVEGSENPFPWYAAGDLW
jgi:hypothetical protein